MHLFCILVLSSLWIASIEVDDRFALVWVDLALGDSNGNGMKHRSKLTMTRPPCRDENYIHHELGQMRASRDR